MTSKSEASGNQGGEGLNPEKTANVLSEIAALLDRISSQHTTNDAMLAERLRAISKEVRNADSTGPTHPVNACIQDEPSIRNMRPGRKGMT
jgi:hypothetical protein